jgi:hypothetical protein
MKKRKLMKTKKWRKAWRKSCEMAIESEAHQKRSSQLGVNNANSLNIYWRKRSVKSENEEGENGELRRKRRIAKALGSKRSGG